MRFSEVKSHHFLRFAPQVLGPPPLNADEPIFTQFFSVPVFTGTQAIVSVLTGST